MLPEEQRKILVKLRIEKAKQCLQTAKMLLGSDEQSSVNRSYYAAFHAIRSILAIDGKDFAKHAGVISEFQKNYIKTRIFDVSLSNTITKLFAKRSASDYDDYYTITQEEAEELYQKAKKFVNEIDAYIKNYI